MCSHQRSEKTQADLHDLLQVVWFLPEYLRHFTAFLHCPDKVRLYFRYSLAVAEKAAVFFEGLFLAILAILPALYFIHYCGENWRSSPLFYAEITLLGVFFVLLVVCIKIL